MKYKIVVLHSAVILYQSFVGERDLSTHIHWVVSATLRQKLDIPNANEIVLNMGKTVDTKLQQTANYVPKT